MCIVITQFHFVKVKDNRTRKQEFSKQFLCNIDIWGQIILCPAHSRMLGSIPSLSPLDTSSTPQVVATRNVSTHCQDAPWGPRSLPVKKY